MLKYSCLNPISEKGIELFSKNMKEWIIIRMPMQS